MAESAQGTQRAPRLPDFFQPPYAAIINHLLKSAPWACARLQPLAGKIVRFNLVPFTFTLVILESGLVEKARAGYPIDASFTVTPGIALRVLSKDENVWKEIGVEGDMALAREVLVIAQNLRWDVEEDLSHVFGDIAAHRMVQTGNHFLRWQHRTFENFTRSAAAYWTDEQPLIAPKWEVERFVQEVDTLRDDVERLAARVAYLTARHNG